MEEESRSKSDKEEEWDETEQRMDRGNRSIGDKCDSNVTVQTDNTTRGLGGKQQCRVGKEDSLTNERHERENGIATVGRNRKKESIGLIKRK